MASMAASNLQILSALVFATFVFAAPSRAVEPLIVNGVPTQDEAATGALLRAEGAGLRASCSGVLVGCRTFLTAAHCVCPGDEFCVPSPSEFVVFLQHAGLFPAAAVVVHPLYSFGIRHDIAVVRLAEMVTGVAPAPINYAGTPSPETPGTIVGFGSSRVTSDDAGIKRRGDVVVAGCSEAGVPIPEPAHICWSFDSPLGPEGSNANTCFGDSGGPLFVAAGGTVGGHAVAGLASGGWNSSCLPPDVAFDTNVFENLSFIESVAGGDIGPAACGPIPPVGTHGTAALTAGSAALTRATTACRKEVNTQIGRYTAAVLKVRQACLDGVAAGKRPGPCPDAIADAALQKARDRLSPDRLGRRCPDSVARASLLDGTCATAGTPESLRECILASGDLGADVLLEAAYAAPDLTEPLSNVAARCQKAVARAVGKYAQVRHKTLANCRGKADRGRAEVCPGPRDVAKMARAATQLERGIGRSCSAAQLAALGSGARGDTVCPWANGVDPLAACLLDVGDDVADTLGALVREVQLGPRFQFEVPQGAAALRVTLNAVDPSFGAPNDLDVYLRFAAEASPAEYDFAATRVGVFEALEVAAPAPGLWHAVVDTVAGKRVPFQLTVTTFGP